jgi:hypothetical protein
MGEACRPYQLRYNASHLRANFFFKSCNKNVISLVGDFTFLSYFGILGLVVIIFLSSGKIVVFFGV